MVRQIQKAIQNWRYLGYDRETIRRYRAETDRSNLRTVKRMCLLILVMLAIFVLFYSAVFRQANRALAIIFEALFIFLLYYYSDHLLDSVSSGPIRGSRSLVFLISVLMYLSGIVSGTLIAGGELGVLSVWMFLLVQISFDIPPLQNLLTVIPFAVVFLIVGKSMKTPERWQLDAMYSLLSVSVGLVISYHQTRLALENIIAKKNLQKANFSLYHTATTDELTGLMNRRMMFDRYDALLDESNATGRSVACVVLDIDDYKQYNDSYGHPAGDELLRRIGKTLLDYSASAGIDIGRIGGEEFLAVWPEDDLAHCERVAEELRLNIERMDIPHTGAKEHGKVTMSVGLCMLPSSQAQSAYFYADKALYHAKDAGKNCSCRYAPEDGAYIVICYAG